MRIDRMRHACRGGPSDACRCCGAAAAPLRLNTGEGAPSHGALSRCALLDGRYRQHHRHPCRRGGGGHVPFNTPSPNPAGKFGTFSTEHTCPPFFRRVSSC